MVEEIVLKYVGGGTFLVGIPARDLTAAEVKEHGGIVELCKTGLYERVAPKVEKPVKAKKKKAETKVTKELEAPHISGGLAYDESAWIKWPAPGGFTPPKDGE